MEPKTTKPAIAQVPSVRVGADQSSLLAGWSGTTATGVCVTGHMDGPEEDAGVTVMAPAPR